MYRLAQFNLKDMARCGEEIRDLGKGAESFEEVSQRIVRYFRDGFSDGERSAFVLARLFKTHPYNELEPELARKVNKMMERGELERSNEPVKSRMRCLTLMGTVGDEESWNKRQASNNHQVIPLASRDLVTDFPMIAVLINQFGVDLGALIDLQVDESNTIVMVDNEQTSFNAFFVQDALGCPYIHAQKDFVEPYGVKSVLGFGGLLNSGDIFAVILFSRVSIDLKTAELFKPLALSTKTALLQVSSGRIFAPHARAASGFDSRESIQ